MLGTGGQCLTELVAQAMESCPDLEMKRPKL
jgi:hypothetical protein